MRFEIRCDCSLLCASRINLIDQDCLIPLTGVCLSGSSNAATLRGAHCHCAPLLVCMNFIRHQTRFAVLLPVARSDWSIASAVSFTDSTDAGASTFARLPVPSFTSRRARSPAVSNQRFDLLNDGSDQRDVFRCRESLRYGGRIVYSLQCSGANHRHAMQRELNHLPMVMVMRDHAPAKGVD